MPVQYITALGYIIAAIVSGIAFYQWRRAVGLYALLVEGANRFEEMRLKGQQVEQALQKADEKQRQHKASVAAISHDLEQSRKLAAALQLEVQKKAEETEFVREKLELQKAHLEREGAKLAHELSLGEERRSHLGAELTEMKSRLKLANEETAKYKQELFLQEKDWKAKALDFENQIKALREKAAKGDPQEIQRLKRKIVHYDRLYASMRGLREMTDERNRNWEVALRHFATWILTANKNKTGGFSGNIPDELGPLVGQALHEIGAQLIDDDEILPTSAHHEDDSESHESV